MAQLLEAACSVTYDTMAPLASLCLGHPAARGPELLPRTAAAGHVWLLSSLHVAIPP